MATLAELEATFLKHLPDDSHQTGVSFAEADGVMFLCPKCFRENGGAAGTHYILCWFAGRVADEVTPRPGRWNPSGSSLADLTFIGPGATSVLLTSGCHWHGYVVGGQTQDC